ncbi:putative respiratory burst oxidase [Klebsormidium nitens]|uniref:Putative respiratory burst oxidase n=1 Tax=Klebsormidium nitens TaxID=105231 RepID=A0A1Y1HMS3_KLENI|nr:putative respiratory burst oxidase [Klebsormidium nitens]|eukprot:GAQ79930.1 putative respiratory burst oxidase [Klebsormidium nitens]
MACKLTASSGTSHSLFDLTAISAQPCNVCLWRKHAPENARRFGGYLDRASMSAAFRRSLDSSVLQMVREEEDPPRTFRLERRLSWKASEAASKASKPREGDVSGSPLIAEGGSSTGDVSTKQEGGASNKEGFSETRSTGLSPFRLETGRRSDSPVSVRTRVKFWEVKAGEGAPSRGAILARYPEEGFVDHSKNYVLANKAKQSECAKAVAENPGACGITGKRDQQDPASNALKRSEGSDMTQVLENKDRVARKAFVPADVPRAVGDVRKCADLEMGLEEAALKDGEKPTTPPEPEEDGRAGKRTTESGQHGTVVIWVGEAETGRTGNPRTSGSDREGAEPLVVVQSERNGAEQSAVMEVEGNEVEQSAVKVPERNVAELHVMVENAGKSAMAEPERNEAEPTTATESKKYGAEQLGPTVFPVRGWSGRWAVYLANRKAQATILLMWLAANAGLFAYMYVYSMEKPEYQIVGFWFCIARGAGEALKLNLALILLPVSRLTTTTLWNHARGRAAALPVQSASTFHEIIGLALLFWTLLHAVVHLTATYPRLAAANAGRFEGLVGDVYGDAQPNYWALLKTQTAVTGFMIIAILLIAYPLAAPCVRRCRMKNVVLRHVTGFEAFWYSHVLLLLCFPLVILHGSRRPLGGYPTTSTWIWLAAPLLFYALDRGFRAARIWRNRNRAPCLQAETFSGEVLGLTLARPPGFDYRPGQYVFINCPRVSAFQWHPFSLTSAPSDALLRVHIRTSVGDWTSALGQTFHQALTGNSFATESTDLEAGKFPRVFLDADKPPRVPPVALPRLLLDGPYAAPSQDFARFKVVILIGAGIGVTPFASVVREYLRHLRPRFEENKSSVSASQETLFSPAEQESCAPVATRHVAAHGAARLEKVYLHWVAKDRAALAWIERHFDDAPWTHSSRNKLEMTSYLTRERALDAAAAATAGAFARADRGTVDVALGGDSEAASKIATKLGRPDWDLLFLTARKRHANTRIGVFYCGPRSLNSTLSRLCCKHTAASTGFEFFKENY